MLGRAATASRGTRLVVTLHSGEGKAQLYPAGYGLNAPFIADAPNFICSAGILVDKLGRWSSSLVLRRFGTHHLNDGEAEPIDHGYGKWNLDIGYALPQGSRVRVGIFNLFDSHDHAADCYYTSRLQGEPVEGVADFRQHPLDHARRAFRHGHFFERSIDASLEPASDGLPPTPCRMPQTWTSARGGRLCKRSARFSTA